MEIMLRTFVIFLCAFSGGLTQGIYKVIGPRVVRPNSEFHASITTQGTSVPTKVVVTLAGVSHSGSPYSTQETLTAEPYTSRIVRLEVGDIDPGDYKLSVRGTGGLDFQSTTPLEYVQKSYSVFIQTDKAVYKPGHKIQFRAVILNSELKPAAEVRNEPFTIHFSDGEGNKVKEWRNIVEPRGVFQSELKLSDNPVLGNWIISVTIHGQTFNKTIQVADYILPKFMIKIDAPKHITFYENILTARIQSLYDYGKKVKGNVTITVYPTITSGIIQPIFRNPVRKVLTIDGDITVNFDIKNELNLKEGYEKIVIIDVTIEEELTGRRQNNSVEVHIHKYDYKMDLIKTADYYKPGLKYTAYVKVSNHDGTAIQPDKNTVTIRHGYSRIAEVYLERKHKLDKHGVIKLEFYPPKNATGQMALRIEAEYLNLKERISPIPAAMSPSDTFLQASLVEDKSVVNLGVEILVNCTEPMKYISFELLSKGDVHLAHTYEIDHKNEFKFQFTATPAMVPMSHLIVSYVKRDGEIVADSLDVEIDGLLQNFIDIQLSTAESRPKSNIDITVITRPNSYVGLLAIDQCVSELKSGYDITQKDVAKELKNYDIANPSPFDAVLRDAKSHFFWKPGGSNVLDMFHDSGALLLTNGYVSSHTPDLKDIYIRNSSYGSSTVKPDRGVGLAFNTVTRPPLAGPYGFSYIPKPVWNKPKVYLAQDISDTWLFTNHSSGYEGKTSFRHVVPETLNTWVITGFSVDPIYGLGLVNIPKQLKVTKNFVVTLDLPYSVQREEILAVPIAIYNHLDKDITAEIILDNGDQNFEFAEISNEVNATKKIEKVRRKRLTVRRNSGDSLSFMIRPLKLDFIPIKVTASSSYSQDTVTKNLLVTAEGETEYYTKTLLIDLQNSQSFKKNISFEIPKNTVPDSANIEVSVVGDLMGPSIINLDNLIRLPTGCGEQNLIHFASSLIILSYLKNTKQLKPTIRNDAIKNLETSYQQQLTYKRSDGSFSAFGKKDDNSSVWITAYVALMFKPAKLFIYIDDNIVQGAINWLAEHQSPNGSFVETGSIIHHELQNRNGNSLALTAYTLMAFLEYQRGGNSIFFTNVLNKGLDYIARNIEESDSAYTVALCSYVLQLAKHPRKENAFNLLDSKSTSKQGSKWWGKPIPEKEVNNPWNYLPRTADIETTCYALLTFLDMGLIKDAIPIVNWLVNQQSDIGGFTSSKDTIMGLHALFKVTTKMVTDTKMEVEYAHRIGQTSRFNINRDNALIIQKANIGTNARLVNVTAKGTGMALFRVSYRYNVNVTGPWPMFILDPRVDKNSDNHHLQLTICTTFVSLNLTEAPESNMAVMEVHLPSGFTADIDSLPSLEVSQNVQRVETKNKNTIIVLYLNNVTRMEYCRTVSAFRTHKIAKQKPVPVIIYDYYDSSRRARVFYRPKSATLCDICEEEDCGDICVTGTGRLQDEVGASKDSVAILRASAILLTIILTTIFR